MKRIITTDTWGKDVELHIDTEKISYIELKENEISKNADKYVLSLIVDSTPFVLEGTYEFLKSIQTSLLEIS